MRFTALHHTDGGLGLEGGDFHLGCVAPKLENHSGARRSSQSNETEWTTSSVSGKRGKQLPRVKDLKVSLGFIYIVMIKKEHEIERRLWASAAGVYIRS